MRSTQFATGILAVAALIAPAAIATASPAGSDATSTTSSGNPGLREKDMIEPLVVGHRGASGYRPEHTLAAYDLAVGMGADYIEPDLVMTKDGVLVDRHEPEIGGTTDVAERPEFADRKTTKQLDGKAVTGWFVDDFTLAELKTLRAKERLPDLRQESSTYDGRFEVPTFEEVLEKREELSRRTGRTIGIIPEIKHSTYLHEEGFDPEAEVARLVKEHHLNHRKAPLWVQSFELTALKDLRTNHRLKARTTFLTSATGGPYDLHEEGTTYAELTSRESMRELSRWIDGFGPAKDQVVARNADGTLGEPTSFVEDAHDAGLKVLPYTFRAENEFLPTDYRNGSDPADFGRAIDEVQVFLGAGVDGVFCDQPDVCVEARKEFLAED
ncbi:MAG: glycerophosphodiester phosphodiesterase [Janibacter sp.]